MTVGSRPKAIVSNCVFMRLPEMGGMNAHGVATREQALRKELEKFGDIAAVRECKEDDVVQVTFYDARCAASVLSMYNGDNCYYGPQDGCRTLVLDKQRLAHVDISQASDISIRQDGKFSVEFFDTRTAAQAASASTGSLQGEALTEGSEGDDGTSQSGRSSGAAEEAAQDSTNKASVAAPRKVFNMQLSQVNWEDLNSSREWRTVLRLRGLPSKLCERGMLEAYLEKIGMRDVVEKVKAVPCTGTGKKVGCALIRAKTVEGVKELAKFFHGRQLGGSLVAVSFADNQSKEDSTKKTKKNPLREPIRVGAPMTTVSGPKEPWCLRTVGLIDLPPGLSPPPGLEDLVPMVPALVH
eukprot:CAMPEP_0195095062 /NCGR_PEP_ID=MMETSP0448-20130528/46610_1 /TAXON_ID=66468 /ORGANISM="Heterocapsa triquestra, Strain CCMP 448" /LENGTH=353 /DNA_ID=CAMNT_0040129193 /DNA_START=57 /DNA_END=1118 /DNA_ORIENTATION=-